MERWERRCSALLAIQKDGLQVASWRPSPLMPYRLVHGQNVFDRTPTRAEHVQKVVPKRPGKQSSASDGVVELGIDASVPGLASGREMDDLGSPFANDI
jgi:hypothetical protein